MAWTSIIFLLASVLLTTNFSQFVDGLDPQTFPPWAVVGVSLVIYLVSLSLYSYAIYPRYLSPYRALPLAKGAVFPFGHAGSMLEQPAGLALARMQKEVEERTGGAHPFFRILFGGYERLVAASPDAVSQIFYARAYDMKQTSVVVALLESSIGKTVLTAAGEEHKEMRKSLVPALAPDFTRNLAASSWSTALRLRDQIQADNFGSVDDNGWVTVDVFPILLGGLLRAFAAVALSVDVDNEALGSEIMQNYETMYPIKAGKVGLSSVIDRLLPVLVPPWLLERLPKSRRVRQQMRGRDGLSQIYLNLVHERFGKDKPSEKEDILDRMCRREFNIAPENAVRQLHALMVAGHETTSCAMAWALFELAKNPSLQRQLRDEARSRIGKPDAKATTMDATTIDSLELLHCFVMEVLRFYPPVSFLPRDVCSDVVICDQPLSGGSVVYMSLIGHNRSRAVFGPDAEEFRPERWRGTAAVGGTDLQAQNGGRKEGQEQQARVTASAKNIHTFGHGARGCLGRDYATRVIKCFTAVLVDRFEMEVVPGHVVEFRANSSTLRPKGGLPLRMKISSE